MKRTPLKRTGRLRRGKPLIRGVRIKARNAKRRASEFARCYHSRERVAFVRSLPCVGCFAIPSDNAHTRGDGAGRKAHYTAIVPACRSCHRRAHGADGWAAVLGCSIASTTMELAIYAAETEARWLAHEAAS